MENVIKEKKVKTPKVKKAPAPQVEMLSYSMRMVIPTGQYANIQPEIIVKATSPEEAHSFIAPHMNKLWKEYYLCSERRPEVAQPVAQAKAVVREQSPVSSVAYTKALQAITSCLSLEAFELIKNQVNISVKLTDEDKQKLAVELASKELQLNGK